MGKNSCSALGVWSVVEKHSQPGNLTPSACRSILLNKRNAHLKDIVGKVPYKHLG